MGLTIGYKIGTCRRLSAARVQQLVQRLRGVAQELGFETVGNLRPVKPGGLQFLHYPRGFRKLSDLVPPEEGWVFSAVPGDGSESVEIGLCRYPRLSGWRLHGWCKTQYAMRHGWEHFLACHRRVVDLLRACEQQGLTVKVDDEGGYWTSRSERVLCCKIGEYDRMVAGMVGALKDAIGDPSIQAPITDDPRFERLEAEGQQGNERWLASAVEGVRRVVYRPPSPTRRTAFAVKGEPPEPFPGVL